MDGPSRVGGPDRPSRILFQTILVLAGVLSEMRLSELLSLVHAVVGARLSIGVLVCEVCARLSRSRGSELDKAS